MASLSRRFFSLKNNHPAQRAFDKRGGGCRRRGQPRRRKVGDSDRHFGLGSGLRRSNYAGGIVCRTVDRYYRLKRVDVLSDTFGEHRVPVCYEVVACGWVVAVYRANEPHEQRTPVVGHTAHLS